MKVWKKAITLIMALGMTVGFASCGSKNGDSDADENSSLGDSVKGQEVATQENWNAAWEAMLAASNFTVDYVMTAEESHKEYGYERVKYEGCIKVADGKRWEKSMRTEEENWVDEEKFTETEEREEYWGVIDGVSYRWIYQERSWEQASVSEGFATVERVIFDTIPMIIDYEENEYEELYELCTFDSSKGAYVFSWEDEYAATKIGAVEFKFENDKLASFKVTRTIEDNDGFVEEELAEFLISYGNAAIGALPGQEGFEAK